MQPISRLHTSRISRRTLIKAGLGMAAALPFLGATCREGFVQHADVRVFFRTSGEGAPVLLHHGFAGSSQSWLDAGYVRTLEQQYQVIAIDARGHGRSDKPHDPAAYTMELRTGDVAAVLDELGISSAHYWGYSMGARTGFAFAQYHASRLTSFINGAAGPGSPKLEETRIRKGANALIARDFVGIASAFGVTEAQARAIMAGNDLDALAAAQLGLLSWDGVNPRTLDVRSLHYAGANDPLRYAAQSAAGAMPDGRFVSLPGLNHLTGFTESAAILPTATTFLG